MKYVVLIAIFLTSLQKLSAQSPQIIKALTFQKNLVKDSLQADSNLYKVFVVIELRDTLSFQKIECNLSTIDSTSHVYITRQFVANTQGIFVDSSSYMKDANFLYLCMGSYILNKPILVEAILKNSSNQRVGYRAIKE